ncbi:PAS domain S-box protein [Paracraurococcus lichenis]|uniref:histidine kinase n=1 Tax=Paracraurococcus lichenis TaxID=3064888 RepID=A0ABT9E9Y0_9PROT|nr:PAS domain S-box protein [Paracraurococcus sp. LOR1-02]MDO9713012.1 PAS domain S-box protein [Paracraurococcus sp. LOR1-02]
MSASGEVPNESELGLLRRRKAELEIEVRRLEELLRRAGNAADRMSEDAVRQDVELAGARVEMRRVQDAAADAAVLHEQARSEAEAELASAASLNDALTQANTDLRLSRAAFRESSELHRLILESATDYAIFTTDLTGRVTSWNEGAHRILGWKETEILGMPGTLIFTPEDRAAGAQDAEMDTALEQGRAADERWHVRKDGSRFWASGMMMPLVDGEVRGFLKILRDRTEQRRAEAETRAAEARANDILEAMGEAFLALDNDFRVVRVNGKAAELDGRPRDEILGRNHWDLWPATVGTPVDAAYRRCLTERVPVALEHHYVSDRHRLWLEIRAYPTADGIAVFYRDISGRKHDEHVLRTRARRLEIVSETAAKLLDAREPEEVLGPLFQSLAKDLGIDVSLSFVLDEGGDGLSLASSSGVGKEARAWIARLPVDSSCVCSHVALTREPMHATDIMSSNDQRLDLMRRLGMRAYVSFPLIAGGRLLGTLSFGTRQRDRFSEADLAFLGTLAQQVAAVRERLRADAEIRQQKDLLATITDHAAEALFLMNREGRITFANPAAEQMFGWERGELLDCVLHDLLHHHHFDGRPFDATECPLVGALTSGEVLRGYEDVFFCKNGDTVDVACSNAPIKVGGEVTGAVLVVHDITERKRAQRALAVSEARLRESEARFRQLADFSPAIVWFGHPDGTLSYLNQAWYEYTGQAPGEGLALGWAEVVHPEDADRLDTAWLEAREHGLVYDLEARLRRRDGDYRWFRIQAVPLRNDAGAVTGWLGNDVDIHDRKAAEEALLDLNEELESRVAERTADRDRMWRLSTDVMLVARFDATITAVNPAWGMLLGWEEADLLGHHFTDLVHPEDREATLAEVGRLVRGQRVLHFENRYRHRDGSYHWLSWTAVPDEDHIHAVGRDITAEKAAAEELARAQEQLRQAQKMEAVGQLTGGLAHDFNNLLTGIIGSLAMLRRRVAQGRTGDLDRYLDAAQSSASRAAALTHRLLAFSRRQTLDPKPTDVARLVVSMEDLIRRTVGPAIEVRTAMSPDVWTTLCDPNQLESALLNLAINARDAMPDGGHLTIKAVNESLRDGSAARLHGLEPGEYVMVSVTDTGSGMSPDVLERVFEPFFTTKPLGQGTGLGLSMVYGFAQQSNGQVRIDSEVGCGTAVHIYLPRHIGAAAVEGGAVGQATSIEAGVGETVLVVDDEPVIRMLVIEVLRELGYRAVQAADGPEALRALEVERRIDLLVTDVGLPNGMNGRQLAEVARQRRPGLKVLFITGYAEAAVIGSDTLGPGMQVVVKPFTLEALATRIRAMISEDVA